MTEINKRSNLATDPIRNFRFLAKFNPHSVTGNDDMSKLGSTTVGFTSISGLTMTTESIPYREGGYNTAVHQIPGQTSFSPITFQRGVVLGSAQNWNWMKQLFRVSQGSQVTGEFRADIDITVLHHPMQPKDLTAFDEENAALRFKIYNAWVTSLAYSDLNAGDNAIMVEQMTVVHEGFQMTWAEGFNSAAAKID